jgi:hypothetical protein
MFRKYQARPLLVVLRDLLRLVQEARSTTTTPHGESIDLPHIEHLIRQAITSEIEAGR